MQWSALFRQIPKLVGAGKPPQGPRPKFPTRRSVLILAGGFSDPSAWVPGRLKATQALGCVDSATALSCPKTALARAGRGHALVLFILSLARSLLFPPPECQRYMAHSRQNPGTGGMTRPGAGLSSRGCIEQSSRQRGRQARQVPDCGALLQRCSSGGRSAVARLGLTNPPDPDGKPHRGPRRTRHGRCAGCSEHQDGQLHPARRDRMTRGRQTTG